MLTRINGLLSCEECGASVSEEMADLHLSWHQEMNMAFIKVADFITVFRKALVEGQGSKE
jgi:hypothetical protein